ncbi:hypothetical protein [Azospirillum argentinense]|uniref:Uncharacterized protein n=1 Tax=Azospirillum argentinense TaxID=2970906 RepID=A0A5B0L3V2_9PROT|nr:hypothetical protein FH063_000508 [Azospirillum argentinense]
MDSEIAVTGNAVTAAQHRSYPDAVVLFQA